jgi:argininosuccinate lyase
MRNAIDSTMMATDLADYLVEKGIPFRETHAIAGKVVREAGEKNVGMEELSLEAYQALCPAFEADVYQVFDPLKSIEKRNALAARVSNQSKIKLKNQRRINHVYCCMP